LLIKLEENLAQKDIEVLIKYAHMNQNVNRLVSLLKAADSSVRCSKESGQIWISAMDIYFIESVDKRTFVYCKDSVYRTEFRLYELLDQLSNSGFVQISKACIVNINMLESIKPLVNSRIEATLVNGEKVNITRKYIAVIKSKLQER
jgi:DNA-binding LytR/AlgR family response regulator